MLLEPCDCKVAGFFHGAAGPQRLIFFCLTCDLVVASLLDPWYCFLIGNGAYLNFEGATYEKRLYNTPQPRSRDQD
jgi:hypothetical protein